MKRLQRVPLKKGDILNAEFRDPRGTKYIRNIVIDRLTGSGSTSMVYEVRTADGEDHHMRMILKEFYPRSDCEAFSIEREGCALKVADFTKRNKNYKRLLEQFMGGFELQNELSDSEAMEIVVNPIAFFRYGDSCYILSSMHLGEVVDFADFTGLKEKLLLFARLTEALDILHQQGYVFSDMKPENILWIERVKTVRFLDVDSMVNVNKLEDVHIDDINYNERYISPQMRRLTDCDDIEFESKKNNYLCVENDIYSAGAMLYEALLDKPTVNICDAIKDDIRAELHEIYIEDIGKENEIADILTDIIMKATAEKRRYRYRSAREFCTALTKLLGRLHSQKPVPREKIARANNMIAMYDLMERYPLFMNSAYDAQKKIQNVAFVGSHSMRKYFVRAVISCGQMPDTELRVHLFSGDSQEFMKNLLSECPALKKTVTIISNEEKIEGTIGRRMVKEPLAVVYLYDRGVQQLAAAVKKSDLRYFVCDRREEENVHAVLKEYVYRKNDDRPVFMGVISEKDEDSSDEEGSIVEDGILRAMIATKKRTPFYNEYATKSRLEKRAYRMHIAYAHEKSPEGDEETIRRSYYNDIYSMESSMRSAAAITYKCAAAGVDIDEVGAPDRYRDAVLSGDNDADKLVEQLSVQEHRSWTAFMIFNGWDMPDIDCLEEYAFAGGNDFKDRKRKLHPCLAASVVGGGNRDPLGRMNDILHRIAERKSVKADIIIRDELEDIRNFAENEDHDIEELIKRLEDAYDAVINRAADCERSWERAYDEILSKLSAKPYANEELIYAIKHIGNRIRVIHEYNADTDYKKLDEAIVKAVPEIMESERYDDRRILIKPYSQRAWQNIAGALLTKPERLILVSACGECVDGDFYEDLLGRCGAECSVAIRTPERLRPYNAKMILDVTGARKKDVESLYKKKWLKKADVITVENGRFDILSGKTARGKDYSRKLKVETAMELVEFPGRIVDDGSRILPEDVYKEVRSIYDGAGKNVWDSMITAMKASDEGRIYQIAESSKESCAVAATAPVLGEAVRMTGLDAVLKKCAKEGIISDYKLPGANEAGPVRLYGADEGLSRIFRRLTELAEREPLKHRFIFRKESMAIEDMGLYGNITTDNTQVAELMRTLCERTDLLQAIDEKIYGKSIYIQFRYSSEDIRSWLSNSKNILLSEVYHELREKYILDDIRCVEAEENMVDMIAVKGFKTYFISVSQNQFTEEERTEREEFAERFGIRGEAFLFDERSKR